MIDYKAEAQGIAIGICACSASPEYVCISHDEIIKLCRRVAEAEICDSNAKGAFKVYRRPAPDKGEDRIKQALDGAKKTARFERPKGGTA